MRIAVAREHVAGETRVASVPGLVGGLTGLGYEVLVEPGAGEQAGFADDAYAAAGALLDPAAISRADLVIGVQPLEPAVVATLRRGAAQVSFLPVGQRPDLVVALRDAGITSFSLDLVPRISRAQPMDALTSQALVAGYRGVVVATGLLRRFFGTSMTAAGTIEPAQVVVLGAGVAGLQAIATAKRLGAVVRGYDVRAAAAEEIGSVGGEFLDLGLPPLEGQAGYARELTAERAERQRALLAPYVAAADVLITTAAVPGRVPPVLVTAAMVAAMRPGSVVVDLTAESGGNVEGVVPGSLVRIGGAQVWGGANVPGQMPGQASELYARNVLNLVTAMTVSGPVGGALFAPDFTDEIVAGCAVTHDGVIVHEPTRAAVGGPAPA